jgi:hypothetical protein
MKNRPVDKLVEATLRIGAAQLLFLSDVPPYAVLKETVDVLRMHPKITVRYEDRQSSEMFTFAFQAK